MIVKRQLRMEWGDCDPAGLVHFPRYFEIFDVCTAALFDAVGLPRDKLLRLYNIIGFPVVEVRADFSTPSRFGDTVTTESFIVAWKLSSFRVEHRLLKDGTLRVTGFETRSWAARHPDDPGRIQSLPIPREVIARFNPRPAHASAVLTRRQ